MIEKHFFVYILANYTNTTVYTGVTSNLPVRISEHRQHLDPKSFTAKYNVTKLVYYEDLGQDARAAIEREKQIKSWNRARKEKLINSKNPDWNDLYPSLFE